MAITFERVIQQALNRLGAVLGATASAAETNYDASPSTSTVIGPDFTPGTVEDALAASLGEIVEAIASTPVHPERQRFADVTATLANLAAIPQTNAAATARIIGVPGFVRDASDNIACLPNSLDAIRSYNRHSGGVYGGMDFYWYAINSGRIEHTRQGVVMGVCVYTRPTSFTGNISLEDWHEGGLVAGIVSKLAPKESLFAELASLATAEWLAHLTQVRSYGGQQNYGILQAAPSST
jgi:hypothetical protein